MGKKYTVHGGHGPHGKLGAGAVGYCSESLVDRQIKNSVIKWLEIDGNKAYDCTCEEAGLQGAIIKKIKAKINSVSGVTANISIHLNMDNRPGNEKKDGKLKGCECWIYPNKNVDKTIAKRICAALNVLGFTNRGVKETTSLGVLRGITNSGANILVECFFCDDEDDFNKFCAVGVDSVGKAIAEGIVGHKIGVSLVQWMYKDRDFGNVDLSSVFNPVYYRLHCHAQEKSIFYQATDKQLFEHFCNYGMKEGRQACESFNVKVYKERYEDLKNAFGNDLKKYYCHYCVNGKKEGRKGI